MVDHPVLLRGLKVGGATPGPTILQRTEADFLMAVLKEVADPTLASLTATVVSPPSAMTTARRRSDASGQLSLFQPVHRTFHLAVFEVVCDTFGQPRLDPTRIESAGLVVRRAGINSSGQPTGRLQRWVRLDQTIVGWRSLDDDRQAAADPERERRRDVQTGLPELDEMLAPFRPPLDPYTESVAPLFIAPPDICAAAGRTILYGLVPVTSAEQSETPPALLPFADQQVQAHLSDYLRQGGARSLPSAGATLTAANGGDTALIPFLTLLRQLAIELDAFGAAPTSRALYDELNSISLAPGARAGDFLRAASTILVEREAGSLVMPDAWPAIGQAQASRLLTLVKGCMVARIASVTPSEGRFDDPRRQYRLQAFVRVVQSDDCPPTIVWSEPSEPFTILPWYDSSNAPPVQIALPNVLDRTVLRNLKPNVSFVVPESLFNTLNANDPKKMVAGEGQASAVSIGLDWICSFSIPIITICAFIVLNIFLVLFDIIFRWLLFIKICIPFPRRQ